MSDPAPLLVVVGQGYVGLPLAMRAVEAGFDVIGVDLDERRVDALKSGSSYVDDVEGPRLASALGSGRYRATSDYSDVARFDVAVITVPTPLSEGLPDLTFIESAGQSLAPLLNEGCTVILESTTYPGTTEQLLVPILEDGSGLVAGTDFRVGYSPERIDPGNATWRFENTPKVVSGIDEASLAAVQAFYGRLVEETVPVGSTRVAELTKLLENTYRHVNIALVNELAVFAHELGVDIWEAIDAASTKPFGYARFTPGPGVGGHCLPVDPSYLSWQVKRDLGRNFRFVELANDVNDHMPDYVVQRVMTMLNDSGKPLRGSRVLLVGLAYKPNTGDIREAPSHRVIELLTRHGADVAAVDPHVEAHRWPAGVSRVDLTSSELSGADIALVLTDHDDVDYSPLEAGATPTLDTKNRLTGEHVVKL